MAIDQETLTKFRELMKRMRILGEQMNLHGQKDDEFRLYAAEIDKTTAELGKLTGADQDPDWPK
jgi:hypothetical protein